MVITNTFTFTENDEQETVLITGFSNARKSTASGVWIPMLIGALALLITFVGLLAGIIWIIRYFYLKSRGIVMSAFPARLSFWGYCISFTAIAFVIIVNISGFRLGEPGLPSYMVFAALLYSPYWPSTSLCAITIAYLHVLIKFFYTPV